MSLCRIITLKNDRTLGHKMSTTVEIERVPKHLILAGPLAWSPSSYQMAASREPGVLENHFSLERDVAISFSVLIVDDLEKKPLFLDKSASHALLLLGEMIEGIFLIMKLLNWRLLALEPEAKEEASRLIIDFVVPQGASSHLMVGASMCFVTALDSLLFVRGLNACDPQVKIKSGIPFKDNETMEIFNYVMTKTL